MSSGQGEVSNNSNIEKVQCPTIPMTQSLPSLEGTQRHSPMFLSKQGPEFCPASSLYWVDKIAPLGIRIFFPNEPLRSIFSNQILFKNIYYKRPPSNTG